MIDEPLLIQRISTMLLSFSNDRLAQAEIEKVSVKRMSFHVVIRFDTDSDKVAAVERHIPPISQTDNSKASLSKTNSEIYTAVEQAISTFSASTGFEASTDPGRADILIHLNLADRMQASVNFSRDRMSRYSERSPQQKSNPALEETTILMPWTMVTIYHRSATKDEPLGRRIEGGEIWIQYPVRTFWQESVARAALDMPELAQNLGLGSTHYEIVAKFRPPHLTALAPLSKSLQSPRQTWQSTRPGQSLLSASALPYEEDETMLPGTPGGESGSAADCAAPEHSRAIGGRLARALSVFGSAFRFNGLILDPRTDYATEYRRDPEHFIAEASLLGYTGSFTARLDDALSPIVLKATYPVRPTGKIKNFAAMILKGRYEEIVAAIKDVALDLRVGDICLSRDTYKASSIRIAK
ncbi:MAG: hypothetical protein HOP09_15785 [Hyphomicrobium sp.]|nr:hypothetical protein [Hyphomicrobium sp.]